MPSPGGQFLSDEFGDIEDYFISDYQLIDQYIGDQLFTWGSNGNGQLGINDTTTRNTPVTTFSGGTNWKSVSAGGYHTAAIKTDGTLWTWGLNTSAQLGNNATTNRTTPVTTFAGGINWKSVAGGKFHTAAIKTDGTLWTWGNNSQGQLGTNDSTQRNTPVTTLTGGTNWNSVDCGTDFTVAIKTDGTLWCWGVNSGGQLGNNTLSFFSVNNPVTTFAGGTNWKSVSAGDIHTAAIKTDGTLWVWGANNFTQLGDNTSALKVTPTTTFAGGTNWKQVSCGANITSAIKTDGTLWIWGLNIFGQLGINNVDPRSTPVTTFAGGTNWKFIGMNAATNTPFAIKTDGTLWTWGANGTDGTLGANINGVDNHRYTPITTFLGGTNWKSVSCGFRHTAAIPSGLNVDLS